MGRNIVGTSTTAAGGSAAEIAPDQVDLSLFPLERFAEVAGALARGVPRLEVLKTFGLTEPIFSMLTEAWAERFRRDPRLAERFQELARSHATRTT